MDHTVQCMHSWNVPELRWNGLYSFFLRTSLHWYAREIAYPSAAVSMRMTPHPSSAMPVIERFCFAVFSPANAQVTCLMWNFLC